MGNKLQMQDWPYLKKYEKENEALKTKTLEENRIVFMGDSITEFWSLHCPDFFAEKPYINRGISGQTTPQMLIRFRADVIELKPKTVILLAGANDIAGNTGFSTLEMILNNIISMVELAKVHQIEVILCSVLPAYDFPWKTGSFPAEKIVTLNKILQEYAVANTIHYLDYYSAMVDERKGMNIQYTDDGVHPNKIGYEVMGEILEKGIDQIT
ncbi:SGNH/GDSL hydrolase family protein [Flavobacterium eburneipallidum]|uniref:SGNH/GDSL hydrolase family protein n=1 Tax=Flavobacterium eburneipallidum TaxID=3003263 RepID=UPI0022AC4D1C|nr:SGNH/GDSL hydrolase family protein [Flavobacterium eburneipallidum]